MKNHVEKFLKENDLIGKRVLLGLSGGADSAVLADILSKINVKVTAIHLNHNWRKEESKRDEIFAKKLAEKYGFDFYTETLQENIKKTETDAREARYDFFERAYKKFKAKGVLLAHNKNDNIETLIYRLIKGTGPLGLNSIPKKRDFYFRPLLEIERGEIEKYAKENGVEFIFDSSNLNVKYKRNLIREQILPLMKEINPNVINSISTFIEINKMNQKIVDSALVYKNSEDREEFLTYPDEIQYELINRKLKGLLKTRDFRTIQRIVNFIKENKSSKISINGELFLKVYNNNIYLLKEDKDEFAPEVPLKIGENKFLNYIIRIEETSPPEIFTPNTYLNLDFKNNYVLRTRRGGDYIQPFASKTNQKLKTIFIKKKINSELRNQIPLIALGSEVLLAAGVITSEKLRVEKNQKKCYKVEIKRAEEWN